MPLIILSQVTDYCAIDIDQAAIYKQLAVGTPNSFQNAQKIYNDGGNSKSYAEVTLRPAQSNPSCWAPPTLPPGTARISPECQWFCTAP